MRTEEDIVRVTFTVEGTIELDRQRITEDDPNWVQIAAGFNLADPVQLQQALTRYLEHYVSRERFLRDMPSTNGPGQLRLISTNMEVQDGDVNREGITSGQEQIDNNRVDAPRVPKQSERGLP
jgi:hypothetical protein